jgi:hypothetical protein
MTAGVFFTEPAEWDAAHHDPSELEILVEVWSRSSDEKDHHEMQWYADRGIAGYWLVTPIEGRPAYRHESTTTLSHLTGRS